MSHLSTTIEGMGGNVSVEGGNGIVVAQSGISTLLISMNRIESDIVTLSNSSTTTITHGALSNPPIISGWTVADDWGNAALVANFSISENADTGQTATLGGGAAVSAGYMQFDGSGDYVTFPDSASYDLSNGPFCIEFSFVANSTSGNQHIINHSTDAGPEGASPYAWAFYMQGDQLRIGVEAWTIVGGSSLGTITVGTEYHVALYRNASVFRWALNGTIIGSTTNSSAITDREGTIKFGRAQSGIENFNGKIRRFRMTVGSSVYGGSSFTPPSEDFAPNSVTSTMLALGSDYSASCGVSGTTITNISGGTLTEAKWIIYGV